MSDATERRYAIRPLVLQAVLDLVDWIEAEQLPINDNRKLLMAAIRDKRFFEIILDQSLSDEEYRTLPVLELMEELLNFFAANSERVAQMARLAKGLTSGIRSTSPSKPGS